MRAHSLSIGLQNKVNAFAFLSCPTNPAGRVCVWVCVGAVWRRTHAHYAFRSFAENTCVQGRPSRASTLDVGPMLNLLLFLLY